MEEALGPGFEVGAAVWARWSGIKFSHGTIERLLSSSKWVLVKLDTDAGGGGEAKSQWVTARDLVLDTPPPPATRHPEAGIIEDGTLVIAAFPNESDYYKGRIVGLTKTTGRHAEGVRYRVQYDDWDDATVDHENVRVLPPDFGAKKKKPEKEKKAADGDAAAAASAAPAAAAAGDAAAAAPAAGDAAAGASASDAPMAEAAAPAAADAPAAAPAPAPAVAAPATAPAPATEAPAPRRTRVSG